MPVKIYLNKAAVTIEGLYSDLIKINSNNFDWRPISDQFEARDTGENQSYKLGNLANIQDIEGNSFGTAELLADYLDGLMNVAGESGLLFLLQNPNFNIQASLGKIEGVSTISKFGENPDVDTGTTPEEIWSYGGVYTFSTSADIDTISSSNVNDNQDIVVVGQDINHVEIVQTATLDGQNKVLLTTPLYRIYRVFNNNGTNLEGDVYVYVDDTIVDGVPQTPTKVRAMISTIISPAKPDNQSMMLVYTVPAGKTLVYVEGYIALSRGQAGAADFILQSRLKDKVFRTKRRISLNSQGTGTWRAVYPVARVVPEKTDIVFSCVNVTANNIGVSGGFEGFLFDNVIWNL